MNDSIDVQRKRYDDFYEAFDSPLARQMRRETYGKDIGQHSWVDSPELEHDVGRMRLSSASRLLDLGCGPGGPMTFVVGLTGCRGTGLDLSAPAIRAAVVRAAAMGLAESTTLIVADLDERLPLGSHSFDAAMSLDVVLHLRNRLQAFTEVSRVLVPGGRFMFTDAGVITGSVSDEEIRLRSTHGHTQFVPPGFNEHALEQAGLRMLDRVDRTKSLEAIAARRHAVRLAHRVELERTEGAMAFERYQRYLECAIALARRGAMARMMYVSESMALPD
jgi:cyclopropane fatty-acyl-phospholipid synthase-like methyltransferase